MFKLCIATITWDEDGIEPVSARAVVASFNTMEAAESARDWYTRWRIKCVIICDDPGNEQTVGHVIEAAA